MDRRPSRSPQRRPPSPSPQRQPSPSPQRPGNRQPSPSRPPQQGGGAPSKQQIHLGYLFDRPGEPIFMPKGDENAIFDVPGEYIDEKYRPAREGIINRNKGELGETIPIKPIKVPDIRQVQSLGKRDNFSLFIPRHRELAGRLTDIFMGMRNYEDFLSASVFCRDKVNPYLYNYALSVAILHRPDTKNVQLPPLYESFPDKFMDGSVFKDARESSNVLDAGSRIPIEIPMDNTASDADPEHRIAYWREDLGINLHHWHWHLVYPFNGDQRIVNKDRRGEIFFYMHQQIQARYNFERLCNGLARVVKLQSWRDPLPEGYFSKLDNLTASRTWPGRHDNAVLSNVYREVDQFKVDLSDMERWQNRILEAIAQGAIQDPNGKRIELDEVTGIDILGNLLESSTLTINRNFYGDYHNFGHVILGLCHDPTGKHLETFSAIADPATSMRDPIFYRFHSYVDYIFQQHKGTLPPYTEQQLGYPGVKISGLELVTKGRNKNEMLTFWQKSDANMSRGVDFTPRGNVFARFTHLQHLPFSYRILIENSSGGNKAGTVRIFLAPKFDERGVPYQYVDHRNLFIELDKFPVTLKQKQTTVERKSTESSVTIPFETTFRNLNLGRPAGGTSLDQFNFCGCGWPQHMLIPKGTAEGIPCVLYAMFSNMDGDKVDQPAGSGNQKGCDDAASYCGIRDQKYPDRRPMGFPFDRNPRSNVDTIRQFLTPNMAITDVRIIFQNRTEVQKRT